MRSSDQLTVFIIGGVALIAIVNVMRNGGQPPPAGQQNGRALQSRPALETFNSTALVRPGLAALAQSAAQPIMLGSSTTPVSSVNVGKTLAPVVKAAPSDQENPFAKADATCNPTPHAGFQGGSLNWGMGFKLNTAQECCDACKAHAKICVQGAAGKAFHTRMVDGKPQESHCAGEMNSNEQGTAKVGDAKYRAASMQPHSDLRR
jgi:hypothetical protein